MNKTNRRSFLREGATVAAAAVAGATALGAQAQKAPAKAAAGERCRRADGHHASHEDRRL
jgi:hypothetical protein